RACSRSQPSPVSQNNSLCSRRRTYGSHFFFILPLPPSSTLFPYTTLFRSRDQRPCTRRYCRLPQVRCCGPSGCTRLAAIHVEDEAQPAQGEVGIHLLDYIRFRRYTRRVAARAYDLRLAAKFFLHPRDNPLHKPDIPEDDSRLQCGDGVTSDRRLRPREFNAV